MILVLVLAWWGSVGGMVGFGWLGWFLLWWFFVGITGDNGGWF